MQVVRTNSYVAVRGRYGGLLGPEATPTEGDILAKAAGAIGYLINIAAGRVDRAVFFNDIWVINNFIHGVINVMIYWGLHALPLFN